MARQAKGEGSIFKTDTGYRGYITVAGKRKYFTASTKAEAAQKKRQLLQQRDTTGITVGKTPTLEAWLEHWLKTKDFKPKTTQLYTYIIAKWLPKDFKTTPLHKITTEQIEALYTSLNRLSGSSIRRLHTMLSSSLNHARKRKHIPLNPAADVENRPEVIKHKTGALSQADIQAIENQLEKVRLKARWHLGLALGLRPGEALGLEWTHIDFQKNTITIAQQIQYVGGELILVKSTKTNQVRTIPLPAYLKALLKDWRERQLNEYAANPVVNWSPDGEIHSWVFTSFPRPGYPVTPDGDRKQWSRILESAGLPYVKPYITRHTAASFLISQGVELPVVAEILGHATTRTTADIYSHAIEERKTAVAELLDTVFQDKVQNKVH